MPISKFFHKHKQKLHLPWLKQGIREDELSHLQTSYTQKSLYTCHKPQLNNLTTALLLLPANLPLPPSGYFCLANSL